MIICKRLLQSTLVCASPNNYSIKIYKRLPQLKTCFGIAHETANNAFLDTSLRVKHLFLSKRDLGHRLNTF